MIKTFLKWSTGDQPITVQAQEHGQVPLQVHEGGGIGGHVQVCIRFLAAMLRQVSDQIGLHHFNGLKFKY